MVPRDWNIGPTIPMGPSPRPSWTARSNGQFPEVQPIYIHTSNMGQMLSLLVAKKIGRYLTEIVKLQMVKQVGCVFNVPTCTCTFLGISAATSLEIYLHQIYCSFMKRKEYFGQILSQFF